MKQIGIVIALIIAVFLGGFYLGDVHATKSFESQQLKADKAVVVKNDTSKQIASDVASQQVIYKDRVIVKYKTIQKNVETYRDSHTNEKNCIDSDFIKIYNQAASEAR